MYLEFFGFSDYPFTLSPDPDFLYLSEAHKQAKSYMDYTLYKRDSFVVITGEIGSGKTTLIENMLALANDELVIARIHQTQLDEIEVLQAIAEAYNILDSRLKKITLLKKIREFMLKQHLDGKHCLLVFDEAQNLSKKALEEIRLLADIEHERQKIVNVLLVGQNQLNKLIDSPDMEQLLQRIRLRFYLGKLDEDETDAYIQTRLSCAGSDNTELFSEEIVSHIYEYTHGTPRRINILCDTLLTAAFAEEEKEITMLHFKSAVQELNWSQTKSYTQSEKIAQVTHFNNAFIEIIEIANDKKVNEYSIKSKTCVIGRSKKCDILLEESRVSSVHAQIVSNESESHLIDLGSTNGTKVNNQAVTRHCLQHGDTISIGKKYKIVFKEKLDNTDSTIDRIT